ncbi:hypothetical protein F5146DRAFT_1005557 [Armillaria mellea]|nr:hypothetical protein F5146DRAFT_1005557 [Armillaria mellea]
MSSNAGTSPSIGAAATDRVSPRKIVSTKDGGQFVFLGTKSLPPILVAVTDPLDNFPHDPKIYLARTWSVNCIPYQAFAPADTYSACQCQLLRRLNYMRGSVPLELKGQKWYLREDVYKDWRDLEMALLRLRESSQSATTGFHPRTRLFSWPELRWYGYAGGDGNHTKLGWRIMNSWAAFILVMAEIVYNAACQPNFWEEVVYRHFVPSMIRAHIPSWIIWGKCPFPGQAERNLDSYRPTGREVCEAEPWTFAAALLPIAIELRGVREESWLYGDRSGRPIEAPSAFQEGGTWEAAPGWGFDADLPPEPMQADWGAPPPDLPPEQGPKIVHEPIEKSEILSLTLSSCSLLSAFRQDRALRQFVAFLACSGVSSDSRVAGIRMPWY